MTYWQPKPIVLTINECTLVIAVCVITSLDTLIETGVSWRWPGNCNDVDQHLPNDRAYLRLIHVVPLMWEQWPGWGGPARSRPVWAGSPDGCHHGLHPGVWHPVGPRNVLCRRNVGGTRATGYGREFQTSMWVTNILTLLDVTVWYGFLTET